MSSHLNCSAGATGQSCSSSLCSGCDEWGTPAPRAKLIRDPNRAQENKTTRAPLPRLQIAADHEVDAARRNTPSPRPRRGCEADSAHPPRRKCCVRLIVEESDKYCDGSRHISMATSEANPDTACAYLNSVLSADAVSPRMVNERCLERI